MKKFIFCGLFLLVASTVSFAQSQSIQSKDKPEDVLGYNPDIILNDWIEWENEQTPENAFIQDFMTEYNVPTTGLFGFSLHNTWMWWISSNQTAINEYLELREQNGLE